MFVLHVGRLMPVLPFLLRLAYLVTEQAKQRSTFTVKIQRAKIQTLSSNYPKARAARFSYIMRMASMVKTIFSSILKRLSLMRLSNLVPTNAGGGAKNKTYKFVAVLDQIDPNNRKWHLKPCWHAITVGLRRFVP